MSTPPTADARISTILLATDLGARCDRATSRAADLARDWGATLRIVSATGEGDDAHVWREGPSDAEALARDEIERALAGKDLDWSLRSPSSSWPTMRSAACG